MNIFQSKTQQELSDLKTRFERLMTENEKLQQQLAMLNDELIEARLNLKEKTIREQMLVATNPLFDMDIEQQQILKSQFQDFEKTFLARSAMWSNASERNTMFTYLLIQERARYFKHRVVFTGVPSSQLNFMLYQLLYLTALNGEAYLYGNDKDKYWLVGNINTPIYDKWGNLVGGTFLSYNAYNSSDGEPEIYDISKKNMGDVFGLKLNDNSFGLWVCAYPYTKKITELMEILLNQATFLNKQIGIEYNMDTKRIDPEIVEGLANKSFPALLVPDFSKIKALDIPDIDLSKIFDLIINFQTYMDTHIMGIRAKDVDPASKSRDIVANQGVVSQQQVKQEMSQSLYLDMLVEKLNLRFGCDIKGEDTNIEFSNELIGDSKTIDKITTGRSGEDE